LSAYAHRELQHHQIPRAKGLYEAALREDPLRADATVNLGVIEAHSGSTERALILSRDAFERVPWCSFVGLNLARLSSNLGKNQDAEVYLHRVLLFHLDLPDARDAFSLRVTLISVDATKLTGFASRRGGVLLPEDFDGRGSFLNRAAQPF
jgi:lipopolysaccharide biosynthesis regulator YciM